MSQDYATKQDVQQIVDKAVTELSDIIANFAQQVDDRFSKVEADITDLKASHDRLLSTMDKFLARVDHVEAEQTARDAQFERLVVWAKDVSKKTGVPLPTELR